MLFLFECRFWWIGYSKLFKQTFSVLLVDCIRLRIKYFFCWLKRNVKRNLKACFQLWVVKHNIMQIHQSAIALKPLKDDMNSIILLQWHLSLHLQKVPTMGMWASELYHGTRKERWPGLMNQIFFYIMWMAVCMCFLPEKSALGCTMGRSIPVLPSGFTLSHT